MVPGQIQSLLLLQQGYLTCLHVALWATLKAQVLQAVAATKCQVAAVDTCLPNYLCTNNDHTFIQELYVAAKLQL
jgi:hypothetical protein